MENNHNNFDQKAEELYNNSNEEKVIRIDRRNLVPINDPKCKHEFVLDPDDPDGLTFDVYKCKNCPVGYLSEKS